MKQESKTGTEKSKRGKEKPNAFEKSKTGADRAMFVPKRPASAGPTAGAQAATAKVTPARLAAFEILKLVGEGKGHSDELLHSPRVDALSPEDRNLTTALVMGVLAALFGRRFWETAIGLWPF